MKRKALVLFICFTVMIAAAWLFARSSSQELDPIKVAGDTHKLVFENKLVRVIETHVPPGKTEPLHEHSQGVVIYLSDFHVRTSERGKAPVEAQRKHGQVRWRERTVHSVVNIGKTEGHVISVELK